MTRRRRLPYGTTLNPFRHREPRARKYRKEFTGRRYGTEPVSAEYTNDGRRYIVRQDGSKVPDHTSIAVSQSIQQIYSEMRYDLKCNNYDELLLDLARRWLHLKKASAERKGDENAIAKYQKLETSACIDCSLRRKSRENAFLKGRYF